MFKRIAPLAMGLSLLMAAPAMADGFSVQLTSHGHSRGHHGRAYGHYKHYDRHYRPHFRSDYYYQRHRYYRPRSTFFFGLGFPSYGHHYHHHSHVHCR